MGQKIIIKNTDNPYVKKWKVLALANVSITDKTLLPLKLEPIFYITVGGKVIELTLRVIKEIGITKIGQLFCHQTLLSRLNFEQRYNCHLSDLDFNAWYVLFHQIGSLN